MINYHLLRLEILRRGQILCMYLLHYILIVYVFAVASMNLNPVCSVVLSEDETSIQFVMSFIF